MLIRIREEFQRISSPAMTAKIGMEVLRQQHAFDRDKEHFVAIGLDTRNSVKYVDLIATGILDSCLVHPREAFRHAIHHCVSSIIFLHNHPSGDTTFSHEDLRITEKVIASGRILGIDVLDHIVIGRNADDFRSMHDDHPHLWRC